MAHLFKQQVVWITGASSGIGRALAMEFARRGALVAVSARRVERLDTLVAELESLGTRGLAVPCDVTDDGAVQQAVATVVSELGGLDVAVANAGMSVGGRFGAISDAEWRRQFDVNVFGAVSTARHALPELEARRGRLCFLGSVAGFVAGPKSAPYCGSKFALRGIGLSLAAELHGTGVSVTLVHPGYVESEIAQVDNSGMFHPELEDRRPKALMWPADKAARAMVGAIYRREREYVITGHGKLGVWLARHTPGLLHAVMTRGKRQ